MAASEHLQVVRAIYPYTGDGQVDPLPVQAGDLVTLLQVLDGGWYRGILNGKQGWLPASYVAQIPVRQLICAECQQSLC